MYTVRVINSETGENVGAYEFSAVPRVSEVLSVPIPNRTDDVRIFTVDRVIIVASGSFWGPQGNNEIAGPMIIVEGEEST